ncbi:DNA cytosine methyltransferase [Novispirillum sp. DQ9]|uniref:DNA cytosine methyltransferase n=1 Tax=Novispirillum sp. DQ9 TaxID=3398612 RepID=UPI003C7E2886
MSKFGQPGLLRQHAPLHVRMLLIENAVMVSKKTLEVPVIDLFAGPGGLGEGFSRYSEYFGDSELSFRTQLSIEKEKVAARTLRLRAFVRSFTGRKVPDCYYNYVRASAPSDREKWAAEMASFPEWNRAAQEAWNATLGEIPFVELHDRIRAAVEGHELWCLLGGPPCQAYSVVGRSRRMGVGEGVRRLGDDELQRVERERRAEAFFKDDKHTLYREYLKIVALHQPAFFVMENVKGILSSRLEDGSYVFDRILADLSDPWNAIANEDFPADAVRRFTPDKKCGYSIHSFVAKPNEITGDYAKSDYLIRCEDYGIPQERHRVILLGIREDLDLLPTPLKRVDKKTSLADVIGDLPPLRSGRSGRVRHKVKTEKKDTTATWIAVVKSETAKVIKDVWTSGPTIHKEMEDALERLDPSLDRGGRFIRWDSWKEPAHELAHWYRDDTLEGVLQHETRDHMDADFARYLYVAAYGAAMNDSPKLRHFPVSLLPDHENAQTEEGRRVFHDRFRVQLAGRPATTVTCHIRKDGHYFIHYDPAQCRSLTVREAARIQTFPDNYFFEGSRTEQYEQVGNAVPPYLAVQLAKVVAQLVKEVADEGDAVKMEEEVG